MPPQVFLSHAGEDKERFVIEFAKRLREHGIDAWFDEWEILPGDSLVDKIFEEGLKNADAIIIVLSEFSIYKPWVREELNASIVKRINKGSKIIPVVLDECEIPESLKSTLWEKIKDLNCYQDNLDRIVASIFGYRKKPPIGQSPKYTFFDVSEISGLNKMDNVVLKLSCESELNNYNHIVNPWNVFMKDGELIVPEKELRESLEILDQYGYIELCRTIGSNLDNYLIQSHGFEEYAKAYISDYNDIFRNVIIAIVNQEMRKNIDIADSLDQPLYLIDHILKILEIHSHVKLSNEIGGSNTIVDVSPSLRRLLA